MPDNQPQHLAPLHHGLTMQEHAEFVLLSSTSRACRTDEESERLRELMWRVKVTEKANE